MREKPFTVMLRTRAPAQAQAEAQARTPVPAQAADVTALTAVPPPLVALPMAERSKIVDRKRKKPETPAAAQTTGAREPVRRRPLAAVHVQVTAGLHGL